MQLGADEAKPLMQSGPFDAGAGCNSSLRKSIADILQNRCILGQQLPVAVRKVGTSASGLTSR
jgi:hypothetical protein